MSILKKYRSPTRRELFSRSGGRTLSLHSRNARRASVEKATQSSPGSLERDGVKSGGKEDVLVSRIAREDSGVPPRGIQRIVVSKTKQAARLVGRIPSFLERKRTKK